VALRRRDVAARFPTDPSLTNLYELEGGKLSRVRVFSDRAEALEAAGLSE
jgi:hypothetical protein